MLAKPIVVYHQDYLIHTQHSHPERKERLEYILSTLKKKELSPKIKLVKPRPATIDEIAQVHDPEYIALIEKACLSGRNYLDMDTYIVPESYQVALLSAGGALTGLQKVMSEENGKAFVLNRPPGHHAEKNQAMGFCLFNNVAIAASKARSEYGLKRIAIVDWDVHHGNGTQHSFEDDSQILFISIHQSPAYPGSGNLDEVGKNQGIGFTVNLPLPAGCGDLEYEICFRELVIPIIDQFKPELIIVSAGQDAFIDDPLAGMSLTCYGYQMMAEQLVGASERWSEGKLLLCLEGGYHLQGQADAVVQILNAMGQWGLPVERPLEKPEPADNFKGRFEDIKEIQKQYWNI
jgi:acetoin utilization deacetylase AcuC-like enzyme